MIFGQRKILTKHMNIELKHVQDTMEDDQHHDHSHDHDHNHEDFGIWPALISFVLLSIGLSLDHLIDLPAFKGKLRMGFYLLAYLPVAYAVIREGIEALMHGEIFTEFFLMSMATLGAFAIGEYPEGVAVMLFYTIGEIIQGAAVNRAKNNIHALLDVRPKEARVLTISGSDLVDPTTVNIGDTICVFAGEKIPLDGTLISKEAHVDTAVLTGESKPQVMRQGEGILAGSINLQDVIEIKVSKEYEDTSIAKMIHLVQHASLKKAKTELLIRRLAKKYTPIVTAIAIAVCVLPYFFVSDYIFKDWLYRALIFLVISCPCALVISIPLGYFGGLGAGSKNGIFFKGATFLDELTNLTDIVFDKTGTLTKGVFKITEIHSIDSNNQFLLDLLVAVEQYSNHPIAKAIVTGRSSNLEMSKIQEIAGKGMQAFYKDKEVLIGKEALMKEHGVILPQNLNIQKGTVVYVSSDKVFLGYVLLSDELKTDTKSFIEYLNSNTKYALHLLSGDKDDMTQEIGKELGIEHCKGGLLPEDKLNQILQLKKTSKKTVAFVGDGINDAPVLAASDIGIAMGAGSDLAIETADIIIQTDEPSKIRIAIDIAHQTKKIIWQNISLAFGVKIIVLILGAFGMATMWEAVFADVGVALLAILNAVRIQNMNFRSL